MSGACQFNPLQPTPQKQQLPPYLTPKQDKNQQQAKPTMYSSTPTTAASIPMLNLVDNPLITFKGGNHKTYKAENTFKFTTNQLRIFKNQYPETWRNLQDYFWYSYLNRLQSHGLHCFMQKAINWLDMQVNLIYFNLI